jgi:hypothetical protein
MKAAYRDHVKCVWKRKTVPRGTTRRECERRANELEPTMSATPQRPCPRAPTQFATTTSQLVARARELQRQRDLLIERGLRLVHDLVAERIRSTSGMRPYFLLK